MNERRHYTQFHGNAMSKRILEAFHIEIYDPSMTNFQEGKLWDTLLFRNGSIESRHLLFDNYISPNTSAAVTNLSRPRQLMPSESFAIRRISFAFTSWTSPEVQVRIAEESLWSFFIGYKRYHQSTLSMMAKSQQLELELFRNCLRCQSVYCGQRNCPNCGAADFKVWNSELDPISAKPTEFYVDLPTTIVLSSQTNFYIQLDHSPDSCNFGPWGLKVWFSGLHSRGLH